MNYTRSVLDAADDISSLIVCRPVQFYHPNTGLMGGTTSFQRLNEVTKIWENAGEISWYNNLSAKIWFGLEEVCMLDNIPIASTDRLLVHYPRPTATEKIE